MSIDCFTQHLGEISRQSVSEEDAAEARRNLSGFMALLVKVNEREQVVPTKLSRRKKYENN